MQRFFSRRGGIFFEQFNGVSRVQFSVFREGGGVGRGAKGRQVLSRRRGDAEGFFSRRHGEHGGGWLDESMEEPLGDTDWGGWRFVAACLRPPGGAALIECRYRGKADGDVGAPMGARDAHAR